MLLSVDAVRPVVRRLFVEKLTMVTVLGLIRYLVVRL